MGGCSIDKYGSSLTDETLADCQAADAVLLGAVGGPKWDDPNAKDRPERGLLALRKGLGVFANLRPVKVHPALIEWSPLKPEKLQGVDILVVRELTGGLYFGWPKGRDVKDGRERAVDTLEYYDYEVRRVMELAFKLAKGRKKKVTSVDKANVLESSRLWRQIATQVGEEHPDVELEHVLVDTAAMRLITGPAWMDVVVTENMFGDILTDEASVLAGSMGMLPSASLGGEVRPGLVRTDPRLGPGYCRAGHRQSGRHDSVVCDAVAPLAGIGSRSCFHRKGGRWSDHRWRPHGGCRWQVEYPPDGG